MLRMGRRHPAGLLLYPGMVLLHKGTMVEAGSIVHESVKLGQTVPGFILTGGGSVRASPPPQTGRLLTR